MKYELVKVDGHKWAVRRPAPGGWEYYSPAIVGFYSVVPEHWFQEPSAVRKRCCMSQECALSYYQRFLAEEHAKRPLDVKVVEGYP